MSKNNKSWINRLAPELKSHINNVFDFNDRKERSPNSLWGSIVES